MSTKAIHLETVSDLSTEAFIAAFDRFASRRGLPTDIYSDQGTNFKGANNHFNELQRYLSSHPNQKVLRQFAERNINWHFNPPSAPHFGGVWEAGIKSTKYHVKRIIGEQRMTFEELSTLFSKIEAILNSRPLCALSADIEDITALTPAHFITGGPLLSLPEYDWTLVPENRLSKWQLIQQLTQHFWQRWSAEYLNTLNQRNKWQSCAQPLRAGDLVMIKDDNTTPLSWPLARVTQIHPGADKQVRAATVRTAAGHCFQRPAIKLCRLPID